MQRYQKYNERIALEYASVINQMDEDQDEEQDEKQDEDLYPEDEDENEIINEDQDESLEVGENRDKSLAEDQEEEDHEDDDQEYEDQEDEDQEDEDQDEIINEDQLLDEDEEEDLYYMINENQDLNDEYIYSNSNIKYKEFVCAFISLTSKIKISKNDINVLLKFIKSILPPDNLIQSSYYLLLKRLKYQIPLKQKICAECNEALGTDNCENDQCKIKSTIDIIKFDFTEELKLILTKYWIKILDYKLNLNFNSTTDICNSKNSLVKNCISLILFADGAQFLKSNTGTIWAILGMICNLPPVIRCMFMNIIKLIFIHNRSFSFNGIVEKHLLIEIKKLSSEGLKLSDTVTVLVYIHGFIADAPARAKCCNSIQFNGEFGCLHCFNPGKLITSHKRIYKGKY